VLKVRRLAFMARLAQAEDSDVVDWRPRWILAGRLVDRDEAAARKIISEEVDRVVKQHAHTVRQNIDQRDLLTLARFTMFTRINNSSYNTIPYDMKTRNLT